MSVTEDGRLQTNSYPKERKKRRSLSPEKKFQIFLESQTGKTPVGEILRREGIYSTDLARIRKQVKEAALERLSVRPGPKHKTVPQEDYEALKRELEAVACIRLVGCWSFSKGAYPVSDQVGDPYDNEGDQNVLAYYFPGGFSLRLGHHIAQDCKNRHAPDQTDHDCC
jgi:transposase-like protein